jgi:replicative DNA helicase
MLDEAFGRMLRRANGMERPIGTPWSTVDRALSGGLWPGLHVLVGNTGAGKSQWALQVALHAARAGTPVLYVGLELGRVDLVARLLGLMDRRRWSSLWLGERREGVDPVADLDQLRTKYGEELTKIPFHLAFARPYGWPYSLLQPHAAAVLQRYRDRLRHPDGYPKQPFLVVLDFLQLVSAAAEQPHQELRERIQQAAYAGRCIAREMDACVLFISGTARENYRALDGRGDKGPGREERLGEGNPSRFVGIGKESGEVEYAADSVLALCREPWPPEGEPPDGTHVWLAVAKTRARGAGPEAGRGWVDLRFNGGWFVDPSQPEGAMQPAPLAEVKL